MDTDRLRVAAGNRVWEIVRPDDLESLWAEMDGSNEADEDFIPYWVEIWPSSIFLTEWIQNNAARLRGRKCLDLGCGLGLTALAAAECGAAVTAVDNNPAALKFARINAGENRVPEPFAVCMDWRNPGFRQSSFDFVWAADIFYEARFFEPVSRLVDFVLKPGGTAVFADPMREVGKKAWPWMRGAGWNVRSLGGKTVKSGGQKGKITLRMLHRGHECKQR